MEGFCLRSHLHPFFMAHPSDPAPQTYPIVCLECQESRLYAEVVQIAEPRCWLRPLWLSIVKQPSPPTAQVQQPPHLYDLHGSSDLLWNQTACRAALDTEILPLLMAFPTEQNNGQETHCPPENPTPEAKQQLHHFLQQLWQTQTQQTQN